MPFRVREQIPVDEPGVRALFCAIYPENPDMPDRMAAATATPNHVTTQLALEEDGVIGQANVYRFAKRPRSANLGYHVHPDHRRLGIACALSEAAIAKTRQTDIQELLIRTQADNRAAQAVAVRLGFAQVESSEGSPTLLWFRLDLDGT